MNPRSRTKRSTTHMLKFRLAGQRTANRQLTYLHTLVGLSVQQCAGQLGFSEKTTMRILLGQKPTDTQLRTMQRLVREYSTEFKIAIDFCDLTREGQLLRSIYHNLYALGQMLARDTQHVDTV